MAGTPADLTTYIDNDDSHDHSYYGNGCPNSWGADGSGGSQTPCTTRIVPTVNDGNQKNGTHYSFQAATSGSGYSLATENTNAPDTFCPLGWQMPYSGTGGDYYNKSRSWRYLFDAYSITYDSESVASVTKLKSYPISYVFSGYFGWYTGRLYNLNAYGYHWSSTSTYNKHAFYLLVWSSTIKPSNLDRKAGGPTLRCVRLSLHRRHGGRNRCRLSRKQYL